MRLPVRLSPLALAGAAALLPACALRPGGPPAPDPRAVQPERPSVATHAGTVAPGYAEVETAVERDREDDGAHSVAVPTELKVGLAPRAQLSLFLPAAGGGGTPFGVGDAAAGVKWRVLEGHPLLQDVAILPQVKLPTGGPRGTRTTDVGLLLIDSRHVGAAALDLNVGVTRRSGDGSRAPRTEALWTVSAGVPVRRALGLNLECFGYPGVSGPAGHPATVAALVAPTLAVRPSLSLDAGLVTALHGPQPHALFLGLVTNVGRLR